MTAGPASRSSAAAFICWGMDACMAAPTGRRSPLIVLTAAQHGHPGSADREGAHPPPQRAAAHAEGLRGVHPVPRVRVEGPEDRLAFVGAAVARTGPRPDRRRGGCLPAARPVE